jgi:hypothetical protein
MPRRRCLSRLQLFYALVIAGIMVGVSVALDWSCPAFVDG